MTSPARKPVLPRLAARTTAAITVVIMGAGFIVPAVGEALGNARVTKLITVIETLRRAGHKHYLDTGSLAEEASQGENQGENQNHRLSRPQAYDGWSGPYIDHPITDDDNPFGGKIELVGATPEATPTAAVNVGQKVVFGSVPRAAAQAVDEAWDRTAQGSWSTAGDVQYDVETSQLTVRISYGE